MATATFLVHLTVPDPSPLALAAEASDVQHDLEQAGHDVQSVAPWSRVADPIAPAPFNDSAAASAFAPPPVS